MMYNKFVNTFNKVLILNLKLYHRASLSLLNYFHHFMAHSETKIEYDLAPY